MYLPLTLRLWCAPGIDIAEVDEDEVARKIVWGWIDRNREKVNLVRPEDVGEALELKRVLADHISDTTDEAWEKVWRI